MSNNEKGSGTSFINIIALLSLLFIGPLAIGGLLTDYNPPIGLYLYVTVTVIYLYISNKHEKDSSEHTTSQSKNKSSSIKRKQKKYFKNIQSGDEIYTNIVGVTFEDRQSVISKLNIGDNVFLRREPENVHDSNAIKVMVHKYPKHKQEEITLEKEMVTNTYIPDLRKQSHELFQRKLKLRRSPGNDSKIDELERSINLIDKEIELKNEYVIDLIHMKHEKIQAGYIGRDQAKSIAPYFDQWAKGPVSTVKGTVIQITGKDEPGHSLGVIISFKVPDEELYKKGLNMEMGMFI